jgi:hypothetical protein
MSADSLAILGQLVVFVLLPMLLVLVLLRR